MKIAIINKSQLNGCWSTLQYTNRCNFCDKLLTCKIISDNHKNGIIVSLEGKRKRAIENSKQRLLNIEAATEKALKIFKP